MAVAESQAIQLRAPFAAAENPPARLHSGRQARLLTSQWCCAGDLTAHSERARRLEKNTLSPAKLSLSGAVSACMLYAHSHTHK